MTVPGVTRSRRDFPQLLEADRELRAAARSLPSGSRRISSLRQVATHPVGEDGHLGEDVRRPARTSASGRRACRTPRSPVRTPMTRSPSISTRLPGKPREEVDAVRFHLPASHLVNRLSEMM